jgi:exosome complex RNA-binding protein Rrp42 (RNase PH superfamily)
MGSEGKANEPEMGRELKEGMRNDERLGEEMRDLRRRLSRVKD